MRISLLFLLLVLGGAATAQPVRFSNATDIRHHNQWAIQVLETDSEYVTLFVSDTILSLAMQAMVVGHFDKTGVVKHLKVFDDHLTAYSLGTGGSIFKSLLEKNYVIGGQLFSDTANGQFLIYAALIKLDEHFDTIWIRKFGLGQNDYNNFYYARQLSDGNYIAVGESNQLNGGAGNALKGYMVKTDTAGQLIWEKSISLSDGDRALNVLVVYNGFMVSGGSFSTSTKLFPWIVKYDNDGNEQWRKRYGDSTIVSGILITPTNYSQNAFWAMGFIDSIGNQNDFLNYNIYKIDTNGFVIKWVPYNSHWLSQTSAIVNTDDGGFVGCGGMLTDSNIHGWVFKFDSNAHCQWSRSYAIYNNALSYNTFQDIKITSDGGLLLCGMASARGDENAWLVKLDRDGCLDENSCLNIQPTFINEVPLSSNVNLYPNPATTSIQLEFPPETQLQQAQISLFDLTGRLVLDLPVEQQQQTIALDLPPGLYFYSIKNHLVVCKQGKLVVK
ncbi:MAG: T9SS type A sorting domain-containing protein [Chitinophagales bacterium]